MILSQTISKMVLKKTNKQKKNWDELYTIAAVSLEFLLNP